MPRRSLLVAFLLLLLCGTAVTVCVVYRGYYWVQDWGTQKKTLSLPITVELERGMSLQSLSESLSTQQLVSSPELFQLWTKLFSDYSRFQAGLYRFQESISPREIATIMQAGEIYEPILYEFTIPEGFTANQIFSRLAAHGLGSEDEFLQISTSPEFLNQWPISGQTAEGYLFPATYTLTEKLSPKGVLSLLIDTFFKRLPVDYETRLAGQGLTLHQGVTFASLIERETQNDAERSIVSEVIWNRLERKIALAIDASIIYGIPNFDGNLRNRHLKDKGNPYNTRVHRGLPPGPIASPGTASLNAVLTPTSTGYFYYVVDADNFSQHRFAKTLREHNRNVSAYVRAYKSRQKMKRQERTRGIP